MIATFCKNREHFYMQNKIGNLSERRYILWYLMYLTHMQTSITISVYSFTALSCLYLLNVMGLRENFLSIKTNVILCILCYFDELSIIFENDLPTPGTVWVVDSKRRGNKWWRMKEELSFFIWRPSCSLLNSKELFWCDVLAHGESLFILWKSKHGTEVPYWYEIIQGILSLPLKPTAREPWGRTCTPGFWHRAVNFGNCQKLYLWWRGGQWILSCFLSWMESKGVIEEFHKPYPWLVLLFSGATLMRLSKLWPL